MKSLGWDRPDVILITGDTYIDSPHIGIAVIGKYLLSHGFKVAVIAQPSLESDRDIARLGEPALLWGVTAGCIDSMVANYTPTKKYRNQDDYTPGGVNCRPDRGTIAYTNLIRRFFKDTKPIVLGGLEASLRRVAHYDYWSDSIRRSVLFDAKADIICYGMAEKTTLALAKALKNETDWKTLDGICYIAHEPKPDYLTLPSYEEVKKDKKVFFRMFKEFYANTEYPAKGMVQQHADRWLIHNPPAAPLSTAELDAVYALDFERDVHPHYKAGGTVRALETIRQSITTHRGCFGQCSFCAIAVHQGRTVVSRSKRSILNEVGRVTHLSGFNGIIYDVGGPTANMYAAACTKGGARCLHRSCLIPQPCKNLRFGHREQLALLNDIMKQPGVKKVFISSGIRHDLVVADKDYGEAYIEQLVKHHVSGQIKLAPEHYDNEVLALMNKPSIKPLMRFKALFDDACRRHDRRFFMTYYLMAAHPGCTPRHMERLRDFLSGGLKIFPEQVQIFTPTPSTLSTAMYWCEMDAAGYNLFCEKRTEAKQYQKDILKKPAYYFPEPSRSDRRQPFHPTHRKRR